MHTFVLAVLHHENRKITQFDMKSVHFILFVLKHCRQHIFHIFFMFCGTFLFYIYDFGLLEYLFFLVCETLGPVFDSVMSNIEREAFNIGGKHRLS